MARLVFGLVLAALVACAHGQQTPGGLSCAEFNTLMCVDKADGTFFENVADCGTPFCHQTYVVCYANAPTVQSCPDGTVWSQQTLTCVAPVDAPGACPVVCGQLDTSVCTGEVDGSVLANPVDCKPDGGLARTFLYCLNEIPVAAVCADGTFFDEALATCVSGDGNMASFVAPTIPGYTAVISEPEEVPGPAVAPEEEDVEKVGVLPINFPGRKYTLALSGKEVTELSTADIEAVFTKVAGFPVLASQPKNYEVTMVLMMPNFMYVLDEDTKTELSDALTHLVADALAEYGISADDVSVDDISGSISTATAKEIEEGQTVYATISVAPVAEDKQTIVDLVAALPEFDTLFQQAVVRMANSSTHVSSDVSSYLAEQQVTTSDYNVGAEVTVRHTEGKAGAKKIEKAVAKGSLAKQMSSVLGESVTTAEVVEEEVNDNEEVEETEEEEDRETVVELEDEDNAGVAATGLLTALAGAALTLALVL